MTFPILVQPHDGRFQASVLGSPVMAADGATKEEALSALRVSINQRFARGELVLLDVPHRAVTDFAGLFKDDPTFEGMVEDIYRERDAQKAAEFRE
ncbi:hypothetical protein VT84_01225 [Gemmata sp. SH-PL17]|uniref:hypothetical protein n=1 Tax=Gemmata sp. SH-PL17 TaxID=1630693 RepID=UPI0004AE89E6|nr:hypothetical protein [Gemmata sp. SH-PL17]AMV23001.1 hypothetical protein VT84_01225 [Gemmata sp. SH-PL17]